MFDITAEMKEEYIDRISFGVHKGKIVGFADGVTEGGVPYIDVAFDVDGIEDSTRLFFGTVKGAKYSFNTLKGIYTHNAPESQKETARKGLDKVNNSEELIEALNSKLVGKELWVSKFYDPTRVYMGSDGKQHRSVNVDVYGYEPPMKPELMPQKNVADMSESEVAANLGLSDSDKATDEAIDGWGRK